MKIFSFDYDTEFGFAWITVESNSSDEKWTVQCCLSDRPDDIAEQGGEFEAKIICKDCGHDWGICGEVNEKAFQYWGENRCMTALFEAAKERGLEVIGL